MIEFQSAHPVRGATFFGFRILPAPLFQSTRPVWGATAVPAWWQLHTAISIHAPRAGCDLARQRVVAGAVRISIHAPRAECDQHDFQRRQLAVISIHAPRAGCDARTMVTGAENKDFNPRTPCGVRRWIRLLLPGTTNFNPRAPCGARLCVRHAGDPARRFQSTRPVWGATVQADDTEFLVRISIHAPRVGRDDRLNAMSAQGQIFQSTRPVWGATYSEIEKTLLESISIHAPRVGRDTEKAGHWKFSTYFNPRAPCGARPAPFRTIRILPAISIHAPRVGRDCVDQILRVRFSGISIHAPRVGRDTTSTEVKRRYNISIHAPRVGRD